MKLTSSRSGYSATVTRVRIERRGGVAGLHLDAEVDAATLTAAQQRALARLIKSAAAAMEAGPAPCEPPAPPAVDRFRYHVEVLLGNGEQQSFDVAEDHFPAALRTLVRPVLPRST